MKFMMEWDGTEIAVISSCPPSMNREVPLCSRRSLLKHRRTQLGVRRV
jgi:hypothetical protein